MVSMPLGLISSVPTNEWFIQVLKGKKLFFPDKPEDHADALRAFAETVEAPRPSDYEVKMYQFGLRTSLMKDLPNGVAGTTIGFGLDRYCRISKAKLARGYGDWQPTISVVTHLLRDASSLQGHYKEQSLNDIAVEGFHTLMSWLIHGDAGVREFTNRLLPIYRVGVPILLRKGSVLLIRW